VAAAALVLAVAGCGGAGAAPERTGIPEGGSSPEQTVETFLEAAREAQTAKAAGEFTRADRAYERMAAVFGTENGSIWRSFSREEVRGRMLVLAACLRPNAYRIVSQPDPGARRSGRTIVTSEVARGDDTVTLPFSLVLGRGERWFIERIDVAAITC
jgi:hypothetical protein